jgi:hypothetical protein
MKMSRTFPQKKIYNATWKEVMQIRKDLVLPSNSAAAAAAATGGGQCHCNNSVCCDSETPTSLPIIISKMPAISWSTVISFVYCRRRGLEHHSKGEEVFEVAALSCFELSWQ